MAHATLLKFGYPDSLVADYRHWCVLLRPAQATLGALVLIAKSEATAFSGLEQEAFSELFHVIRDIETGLKRFRTFAKINYLMLMMVDPQVHFHIFPRYASRELFGELNFTDPGWPGPPDIRHVNALDSRAFQGLRAAIESSWPKGKNSL